MTKEGTENFGKLCNSHTLGWSTQRWPMRLWYAMVYQAGITALVFTLGKKIPRTTGVNFWKTSQINFFLNHQEKQPTTPGLQVSVKNTIWKVPVKDMPPASPPRATVSAQSGSAVLYAGRRTNKLKMHAASVRRPVMISTGLLFVYVVSPIANWVG